MKVAIMGAGLSGLSCGITLERAGIQPVIFEKRRQVGDRFINGEILLSVLSRPAEDCLAYLADNYGIFLKPVGNIRKLVINSEKEQAVIEGQLGFSNLRGRHENSFERQLAHQVQSKIIFNSRYTYEELLQEFTHVVVATGDADYAAKIQTYEKDLTVTLKGATVTGDFDRYTVAAWLNHRFAPKGYCYFIPLSDKEANIVIAFPDYPENKRLDINTLWDRFYRQAQRDLGQDLRITDGFEIEGYIIGLCQKARIGNTFFTGNCFGSIMPFMGFGQFSAILTGIYAAYDLCGIGDYNRLTLPLRKSYHNSLAFRRIMEKLNNYHFDLVTQRLQGELGKRLFNTRYDVLKVASYLLRPLLLVQGANRR